MQLVKEIGGEVFLRWIDLEFFEQVFDFHRFLELRIPDTRVALVWVQLVKEVGGEKSSGADGS